MAETTKSKPRFRKEEKLRPEDNADWIPWNKRCIRIADEEDTKTGAASNTARRMRGVTGAPPFEPMQGEYLRPTTQDRYDSLPATTNTSEYEVVTEGDYYKKALASVKEDIVKNCTLNPAAHKLQGEIISCIRVVSRDGKKILELHSTMAASSVPLTPIQAKSSGGGGSGEAEQGTDGDAPAINVDFMSTPTQHDEKEEGQGDEDAAASVAQMSFDPNQTINSDQFDKTVQFLTSEIEETAKDLMWIDLKKRSVEWVAADHLVKNIMLEGVLDREQFINYSTASELYAALETYANVKGVGVLPNVMVMNDTFAWQWLASKSVHHNTHLLHELIERYHRACSQFIEENSKVGEALALSKDVLKVTLLIARSYSAFREPYESVSAQEQIKEAFAKNQDNFGQIFNTLSSMLHQWQTTRTLTKGDRAHSSHETTRDCNGNSITRRRCRLCHYGGHTEDVCQAKDDPAECKRRRKKVEADNIRTKKKKKEIANRVIASSKSSSKSKSTNRSTPSNAEKETIKKLVEHGWTAPEEPKETENARDSAEAWGDSVLEYFQDLR